jgi:hypothetical protein
MGHLLAIDDLPFMRVIRRDEAAPVLEGGPTDGFLGHRLDPGIDRRMLGLGLL